MLEKARIEKITNKVDKILQKGNVSQDITYSLQEKDGIFQCVIRYRTNNKWNSFWSSTGIKNEKGNLRNAKRCAEEIADIFKNAIKDQENKSEEKLSLLNFQEIVDLNTTNFNPNKETKADWDFYEYMEYWLFRIIKKSVEQVTFNGYKRYVTGRIKDYFTMKPHKKKVKEITADDLDDFYDYLRDCGLCNSSIDHYNDNISSAFQFLLRKKLIRYNPTKLINPIVVVIDEVPTYTKSEINQLFEVLKGDVIELPILFDGYYGLRRSEIIGLKKDAFDFENNNFIIKHVAIQNDGKDNKEKVYFRDKTKSKKGYRTLPLFPIIKEKVLERLETIEKNKEIFGNSYNHEYDDYICLKDNGDLIQPNYLTKRLKKVINRNNMRKITPHGLRHSIATLLHIEGVDIRDIQDWLGHENITSTNRYTRSDYKKQLSTGNKVIEMFGDNKSQKTKKFTIKKKNIYVST